MEMDITVKDVIFKIRSLRNIYNSEKLKLKKSCDHYIYTILYKSKIPWLGSLDVLKNIDSCTRTNTSSLVTIYIFVTFISDALINESYSVPKIRFLDQ
nr:unnamed protein product [Callosobruchus analis]